MQRQLVSIIISTYNNEKTIRMCLESIEKQTYPKIEVIVVDEYSKDKTIQIARPFNSRVFLHGKERANNRNFGMQKARGKYYCIIDSDMELTPKVIEECVDLCKNGGFDAVVIRENSRGSGYWAHVRAFERNFIYGDDVIEASRFFPAKLIEKIGGYDPNIVGAEDWDLHQRILKKGYKVARTKNHIIHQEGRLSLKRLLMKKKYYGNAFLEFKRRYPEAFRKSVVRVAILKNWYRLILQPKYGIGLIILKFLEGMALFYGMTLALKGTKSEHY